MAECNSIVPVPGVNVRLVEVQVPPMIRVPPLVISSVLDPAPALTLDTFNRFVPLAAQLRVRPVAVPMVNVP